MKTNEIDINVCIMDEDEECIETFNSYNDAEKALPKFDKGCEIGYYGERYVSGLLVSATYKSMRQVFETLSSVR